MGRGATARARQVAVLILDPESRFVKSPERDRPERDLPQRVVDLLERDGLVAAGGKYEKATLDAPSADLTVWYEAPDADIHHKNR